MTDTHILGDKVPRKSNFDPDLARKVTEYYAEHPEELKDSPAAPLPASNTSGPLEVIKGNYLTAIQAAIPENIQTAAELQKARVDLNSRNDTSLNYLPFYTANVPLYGVENDKPFLLFGGREAFLRLYGPKIEDVYSQILVPNEVYILPEADKAWALDEGLRSGTLTRFDLTELFEERVHDEYGYFPVNTKNGVHLSGAKRKLAELIYGSGSNYFDTLKMLSEKVISKTKVWIFSPKYISAIVGNNLVGSASMLSDFGNGSSFDADDRNVSNSYSIRGVRKK